MDEETREHLFEPFFTTKSKDKGTGLGLATVYGIVTQHGGGIAVQSAPGQGAVFELYLPATGESRENGESDAADEASPRGTETVLLAEDSDQVRSMTASMLRRLGYEVLLASSGREALEMLERHPGKAHLLLSDVVMPEMNGPQLQERVALRWPEMKFLFMSGYTGDAISQHGEFEKIRNFIHKPFTLQVLAAKVREALERE
ncbi:MAG: Blue-light-activated protein [candidate division BRC1 bacterium ADurb.BinA364]|nr:MAG: Blue-light-activated protein [candidate division BRC1 bacterium ADurb.BinA364]